ncbi:hypothetical protein H4Q26_010143 [Puccinia striiformis f. sp. tritici PST-130]|nr:hypothetical protein H4Q26_010143 [Puccinia striiformis f. sp. tritici PST-130]
MHILFSFGRVLVLTLECTYADRFWTADHQTNQENLKSTDQNHSLCLTTRIDIYSLQFGNQAINHSKYSQAEKDTPPLNLVSIPRPQAISLNRNANIHPPAHPNPPSKKRQSRLSDNQAKELLRNRVMTLTDDDSDLSETLSSAGSTIPLPSSELGSRAASEDPTSPSGLAHPSKPFPKLDRRRKSPSSSSASTSDRVIKAESLPPPIRENGIRRNSISTHFPRPTSARDVFFEPSPHTTPQGELTNSSNSIPHPCTSHGHLPLFEQPVLLQGARPRRKPNSMTIKSKKTHKGRKPKGHNAALKPTLSSIDQDSTYHPTMDHEDSATQTATSFQDEESSLTEQSSSDEASLTDRAMARSRTASPLRKPAQTLLDPDSEQSASRSEAAPRLDSTHDTRPSSCSITPTLPPTLSHRHPQTVNTTSAPDPTPSKPNSVKLLEGSSFNSHQPNISNPDSQHACTSSHPDDSAQLQGSSTTSYHPQKINGRNTSEESALTPDPEDVRPGTDQPTQLKPSSSPQRAPNPIPNSATVPNPHQLSPSCPSPVRSLPADPPTTNHHPPATSTDDILMPTTGLNHKSRPPNIIPPSILKPNLGTSTIVDRTVEGDLQSSTFATDRYSVSPLPSHHHHLEPSGFRNDLTEHLSDDALDGVPIIDDMMEYELDLYDEDEEQPTLDALMDLRQEPSEAGTSAVDGVPVPDSEDVLEDLDAQPSPIPQPINPTGFIEPDSPSPPKSEQSPEYEQEPPKPRPEKPKHTKTYPPEVIYEHDDHVRRREDALEAMVKIEIMFAQVRDRLYVERLSDVHRETAAVHHEIELDKKRQAATNSVWTKWYGAKAELHDTTISETQNQMKQLEREKFQPDLRYNVERTRMELDESSEEILAIQLHTSVAKRATVNLSTLTAEETWADLSVMKPHSRRNTHLDPVNILCTSNNLTSHFGELSEPMSEQQQISKKHLLQALGSTPLMNGESNHCSRDPAIIIGAEKLIGLNPKLIPARSSHHQPSSSSGSISSCQPPPNNLSSPSARFEPNHHKHPRRLGHNNHGLDNLTNSIHTSSSRTVRNSNRPPPSSSSTITTSEPIEPELINRIPGTLHHLNNGQYFKSDRRPTLDSVMAHNTPERMKAHHHHHHHHSKANHTTNHSLNGSSTDPLSYSLLNTTTNPSAYSSTTAHVANVACIGPSSSSSSSPPTPNNYLELTSSNPSLSTSQLPPPAPSHLPNSNSIPHRHPHSHLLNQPPPPSTIQNNNNNSNRTATIHHPTNSSQLYPTTSGPITVNYHERVPKTQIA